MGVSFPGLSGAVVVGMVEMVWVNKLRIVILGSVWRV